MERARRKDARQVFILISDGHGQEYWNVVQATGKRLQETNAELFAVSASRDYNEAELLIYVGDKSRVFVGPKYTSFLPTITSYVKDCIIHGDKSFVEMPLKPSSAKFEGTAATEVEPILPVTDEFEDEEQVIDGVTEESPSERSAARLRDIAQASSCDIDLLFIIDSAECLEEDFKKEIAEKYVLEL
ncbi:unnamed protein product [Strongylus vulgaris]|uniref:VWFA domain-containing protein n=1 Tax=Strongylus vulgaris TaxID=40348 RepID=A0A3P7J5D8_STRVU|nr:unnamed protein product [Strongylus vulgaris]